ncbi:PRC-barrel domain-containing protein [Roseovarius sp. MMSF_3281]|uniref:PRC-barrel domain-containing protein n=1 Tax=Roseovarius sp. MMSF_3281 TaxID=3046694 RepID=UPI0035322855
MKFLGTSAIAMALAATTAFADSHSESENHNESDKAQVESNAQMNTSGDGSENSQDMDQAKAEQGMDQKARNASGDWTVSTAEMSDMQGELIRTRDITGGAIYTTNEANDEGWENASFDAVNSDWNQIGEIEDIVLSKNGKMTGIVAEVGGFLGMADKHVVLSVDDAKLVPVDDVSYAFVTQFNEEQLEEMNGVDEGFWN